MAKDGKFGTFGGVFTPSILTILGVIMYMRLPWLVGQGGLWTMLGIIAVAHVISVTTGLSISSIATDKNVGAGGDYYIVSRSLGLPIGGTLGLAMFLGLAFSVSLYVIGFTESLLGVLEMERSLQNIRLIGTLTVIGVTVITLISTAFAIKTQYIILVLISVSLVVVFGGGGGDFVPATPNYEPSSDESVSVGTLFGIFFPAVTGFTAGVSMSGDLRDAKKSIPRGTMIAIIVGALVYFGEAIFFAYRVDREVLINDPQILLRISLFAPAVVAGVWGATLSSAIGSILGAPRILQALSVDRITPRFFGKGSGKTNEPRRALLLAFAIGEGGILIGELDVIARVVSMVFLASYGFLNLSCAIESWASPDFRPAFRIPRIISIVGAVTSAVMMIQLDLAATAGATALMVAAFLYLKRRELHLAAGDTWEGIWSSIVRAGLHRLHTARGQRRNWRPNVLLFADEDARSRPALRALASELVGGNGILTDFQLFDPSTRKGPDPPLSGEEPRVGIFERRVPSEDPHEVVRSTCRFHGFSGLAPNAVMLDRDLDRTDADRFAATLRTVAALDLNLLLLAQAPESGFERHDTIDVWWRASAGNVSLGLAIVRFLTRFEPWQGARVRFLLVSRDSGENDNLRATMRALLAEARVEAAVRVFTLPATDEALRNAIVQESGSAALTILGLPKDVAALDKEHLEELDALAQVLGPTLFLRGSSVFPEVLPVADRAAPTPRATGQRSSERPLAELDLPDDSPELARECQRFADRMEHIIRDFHDRGVKQALARDRALVEGVRDLVERHFEILRRGVAEGARASGRKPASRAQSGFLFQARKQLGDFEADELPAQRAAISGRVEACVRAFERVISDTPPTLRVIGRTEAFRPRADDPPALRSFKRRRRFVAWITRLRVAYDAPLQRLVTHFARVPALQLVEQALARFESTSHRTTVQLGKILNAATTDLATITTALSRGQQDAADVEARKQRVLESLDAYAATFDELDGANEHELLEAARGLCQSYANDLARVDVARVAATYKPRPKDARALEARIRERAEAWQRHHGLLLQRAQLGLLLAAFHQRFTAVATKAKNDVVLGIRGGALAAIQQLHGQLKAFYAEIEQGRHADLAIEPDLSARFSVTEASEHLTRDVIATTEDLPETSTTISDEAIAEIEAGTDAEVEELSVSVRPLVQYLIESEFAATVSRELTGIPAQEQRALGTAQDVARLIEFSLGDLETMGGWRNEAFRNQMMSVVRSGLERLEEERESLSASVQRFESTVDRQLQAVIEGTDPYQLTTHSENLGMYIRSREGQKAVSRVRELVRRGTTAVRTGAVKLLYRRSTGLLLARRLAKRQMDGDAVFDRAIRLTRAATPPDRILRSLPFYYRQLFSGQATISETFWVGREEQLEAGKAAARAHAHGAHGAIFVTGETGSGKTAFCHVLVAKLTPKRKLYRIVPPAGGSIDPDVLRRVFETELKQKGSYERMFRTVPDGSIILLDDCELWWERADGGLAVVEVILQLVQKYGDRLLFVVNINRHAYRMLERFVRLGERALTVIECDALSAENLKSIITLRHASTGFRYRIGRSEEEHLAPWQQARLFTRYFDYSGGMVGPALRGWLANIEKIDGTTLSMRPPSELDGSVVDSLRVELLALLVQLVLHKQVTMQRLERITGLGPAIHDDLDRLVHMGLVRRDDNEVMHCDRFVAHVVSRQLRDMGLLA